MNQIGKLFIFFEVTLCLFAMAIFMLVCMPAAFAEFYDLTQDTSTLINYGFAIMISLSGICFTWAKSIEADKKSYEDILNTAKIALYGTTTFLMASGMKYVIFNKKNPHFSHLAFLSWEPLLKILVRILFFITIIAFMGVLFRIMLSLLYFKIHSKKIVNVLKSQKLDSKSNVNEANISNNLDDIN